MSKSSIQDVPLRDDLISTPLDRCRHSLGQAPALPGNERSEKKRREGAGQRKKERKNDTAKESREQWRIGGRKKSESLLER